MGNSVSATVGGHVGRLTAGLRRGLARLEAHRALRALHSPEPR